MFVKPFLIRAALKDAARDFFFASANLAIKSKIYLENLENARYDSYDEKGSPFPFSS